MAIITEWERGFILHARSYSETSLLLDIFLEQSGRMTLLAKGARRKQSPLKGILQPFTPLLVKFRGHSTVKTLTHAEAAALTLPLSGIGLYSGFYINELLTRTLVHATSSSILFFEYLMCLQQLSKTEQEIEPALRRFEFILLENLGYQVDFSHCAYSGDKIKKSISYKYTERVGFAASAMKIQNHTFFTGGVLQAFAEKDFSTLETLQAAKRFTRMALKPFLGSKPLKSRELFSPLNIIKIVPND